MELETTFVKIVEEAQEMAKQSQEGDGEILEHLAKVIREVLGTAGLIDELEMRINR